MEKEVLPDLPKIEPLDRELEPYLSRDGIFPMLRHPLVYCVPYTDLMAEWANRSLAYKKASLSEAVHARNWTKVLGLYERPYRVDAMTQYAPLMEDAEYWKNLAWIYTDSENIEQSYETWDELLSAPRASREAFMCAEERALLASLPDRFEIYRGCKGTFKIFDEEDILDYSWSLSPKVAAWFAQRFRTPGFVIRATVDKADVVGYKDNRAEREILVHRDNVRDIELCETPRRERSPRMR